MKLLYGCYIGDSIGFRSFGFKLLKGGCIYRGLYRDYTVGVIKGDTRSLDYDSYPLVSAMYSHKGICSGLYGLSRGPKNYLILKI